MIAAVVVLPLIFDCYLVFLVVRRTCLWDHIQRIFLIHARLPSLLSTNSIVSSVTVYSLSPLVAGAGFSGDEKRSSIGSKPCSSRGPRSGTLIPVVLSQFLDHAFNSKMSAFHDAQCSPSYLAGFDIINVPPQISGRRTSHFLITPVSVSRPY